MTTKQLGFHIDLRSCTGCKACQIACRDKNDTDIGVLWRRIYEVSGGDWFRRGAAWIDNTLHYFVTSSCSHCTKPACLPVCPTTAISKRKEDGVVIIDQAKCVGCGYCEWACPYGAPQLNPKTGTMSKCDFCVDYLNEDKDPACVAACQMRVLHYGDMNELRAKYGNTGAIYPFPDPSITQPNTTFIPHKHSMHSNNRGAETINAEEV